MTFIENGDILKFKNIGQEVEIQLPLFDPTVIQTLIDGAQLDS